MEKIGVLCGDFDPVYTEILAACEDIAEEFGLSRIFLAPFGLTGLRRSAAKTGLEHRKNMLRLVTRERARVKLLEDMDVPSPHADHQRGLVDALAARYDAEVYYIMGSDQFLSVPGWKNRDGFLRGLKMILFMRPNASKGVLQLADAVSRRFDARIEFSSTQNTAISQTMIHVCAQTGFLAEHIPRIVLEYIEKNLLYKAHSLQIERVRDLETPEEYARTAQFCLLAAELANILNLSCDDALLVALLTGAGRHYCYADFEKEGAYIPEHYRNAHPAAQIGLRAELAAQYFIGVTAQNVLDAVKYHATGRPRMSPLEILAFMLSEAFSFVGRPDNRTRQFEMFENPADFFIRTLARRLRTFRRVYGFFGCPSDTFRGYLYYRRVYKTVFDRLLRRAPL